MCTCTLLVALPSHSNLHLSRGRGIKGTQNSAEVNKGDTRGELAKVADQGRGCLMDKKYEPRTYILGVLEAWQERGGPERQDSDGPVAAAAPANQVAPAAQGFVSKEFISKGLLTELHLQEICRLSVTNTLSPLGGGILQLGMTRESLGI